MSLEDEELPVDSADVARVRAIEDPETRMAAAHEEIRRRLAEMAALVDIRQAAAVQLREATPGVWSYSAIAERLGLRGVNPKQDGQQIVRGRRNRRRESRGGE